MFTKHETRMNEFSRNRPENGLSHYSENWNFNKYLDKFSTIFWKFTFDFKQPFYKKRSISLFSTDIFPRFFFQKMANFECIWEY